MGNYRVLDLFILGFFLTSKMALGLALPPGCPAKVAVNAERMHSQFQQEIDWEIFLQTKSKEFDEIALGYAWLEDVDNRSLACMVGALVNKVENECLNSAPSDLVAKLTLMIQAQSKPETPVTPKSFIASQKLDNFRAFVAFSQDAKNSKSLGIATLNVALTESKTQYVKNIIRGGYQFNTELIDPVGRIKESRGFLRYLTLFETEFEAAQEKGPRYTGTLDVDVEIFLNANLYFSRSPEVYGFLSNFLKKRFVSKFRKIVYDLDSLREGMRSSLDSRFVLLFREEAKRQKRVREIARRTSSTPALVPSTSFKKVSRIVAGAEVVSGPPIGIRRHHHDDDETFEVSEGEAPSEEASYVIIESKEDIPSERFISQRDREHFEDWLGHLSIERQMRVLQRLQFLENASMQAILDNKNVRPCPLDPRVWRVKLSGGTRVIVQIKGARHYRILDWDANCKSSCGREQDRLSSHAAKKMDEHPDF